MLENSQPGGQSANLQGLWNEDMNPWWECKFTTNINTEMNYWPAETTVLGLDDEFGRRVAAARDRLAPLQIGKLGQVQEWLEDWGVLEQKHRHVSQLYGLFPSNQITPAATPNTGDLRTSNRRWTQMNTDKTKGIPLHPRHPVRQAKPSFSIVLKREQHVK